MLGGVCSLSDGTRPVRDAVADAYGWPVNLSDQEILSCLVALNAERQRRQTKGQS